MILSFPDGYDTSLERHKLSGGQRQRIGLARALYGDPILVVLDEPNSNLDDQGEQALFTALRHLKARGATTIVVSHRMNILSEIDALLLLTDGAIRSMGPRDQVLQEIQAAHQKAVTQQSRSGPSAPASANVAAKGTELLKDKKDDIESSKANDQSKDDKPS